ncbi:MAG: hypothetical protein JFR41_11070 [Muribaculaceae bacterium]|nr:hypothetical protein [Muribaculaceae bacterium]
MSCACENRRLSQEYERIRRLAKDFARLENKTVALVKNANGTYSFHCADAVIDRPIVEYITPY